MYMHQYIISHIEVQDILFIFRSAQGESFSDEDKQPIPPEKTLWYNAEDSFLQNKQEIERKTKERFVTFYTDTRTWML